MGSRTLLRVFLVICSLLLAVVGKQYVTKEAKKEKTIAVRDVAVQIDYVPVGCFKDKGRNRALEHHVKDFRKFLGKELWKNWPDMSLVIQLCAEEAFQQGYTAGIGLQFYGECFASRNFEMNYAKYGKSKNCINGVGKHWTNYVYRIEAHAIPVRAPSAVCNVSGQTFKDGDSMQVYEGDLSSGECHQCTCKDGMLKHCHHIFHCVLNDSSCNSYSMRPGQCCPTCERDVPDSAPNCTMEDGRVYKEGESVEFLKQQEGEKDRSECHQCNCTAGQMQDCHRIYYCDVRKNGCTKFVKAGQCCPTCAQVISKPAPPNCEVNGRSYKDGESMERLNMSADNKTGQCDQCTCNGDKVEGCHHIFHCSLNSPDCASYKQVSGQCCLECVPVHANPHAPSCQINGLLFKHGESAEVLHESAEKKSIYCQQCECQAGNHTCHKIYDCDIQKLACEKSVKVPGQCCPICACYNNGQQLGPGDKWQKLSARDCVTCTCQDDGTAKCRRVPGSCQSVTPKPVPPNCEVNGRYYKDGESMEMLKMSADNKTGACHQCTCNGGKDEGCHHIFHCSLNSPDCASYKQVSGQCCLQCVPVHANPHAPSCQINGLLFKHGESAEVLHESADKKSIYCQQCKCQAGNHTCHKIFDCDIQKVACEKSVKIHGQCCPICACYNNGQQLGPGNKWQKLSGSDCVTCTCQDDGTAKCRRVPGACQSA